MKAAVAAFLAAATLASAKTINVTEPSAAQIAADRATVQPLSPTSNVKGLAFDRFIQIWLENTVCGAVIHALRGANASK
jgi:acid phosphatase